MAAEKVVYTITLNDLLSSKLKDAEGNAVKLDNQMGKLDSRIKQIGATIAGAFALDKIAAFGQGIIAAGSKVEDATTGLTTLLGNSAEAAQVVTNTMEDATKTPFAFEGLLAGNQQLIAAGVNSQRARTDVMNLANAVAASGKGNAEFERMVANLAQISTVGKATSMDIKQFGIAGINIYKVLAEHTKLPIDKVKEMDVSYDLLTQALASAHEKGGIYYNGLENMSQNTSVKISNLGDGVFNLQNKMFTDLKPAIDSVVATLAGFIESMSNAWSWMVKHKEEIGFVASALAGAGTAMMLYKGYMLASATATALWTAYTTAATAAEGGLTIAQWAWNAAMTANPIGLVVAAIGALIGAVVYAWNNFVGFRAVVMGVWGVLKEFGRLIMDYFTGIKDIIVGVVTFDPAQISAGVDRMAGVFTNAGSRIAGAYNEGYDAVMADHKKKQEKEAAENKTAEAPAMSNAGKTAGTAAVPSSTKDKKAKDTSPKGATGSKSVTITINIAKLIEQFKVETTNITGAGGTQIREAVAQALLGAVRDSQIVAGI